MRMSLSLYEHALILIIHLVPRLSTAILTIVEIVDPRFMKFFAPKPRIGVRHTSIAIGPTCCANYT
jgi:hypothetical protein